MSLWCLLMKLWIVEHYESWYCQSSSMEHSNPRCQFNMRSRFNLHQLNGIKYTHANTPESEQNIWGDRCFFLQRPARKSFWRILIISQSEIKPIKIRLSREPLIQELQMTILPKREKNAFNLLNLLREQTQPEWSGLQWSGL